MVSLKKRDMVRDDLSDETINRYFILLVTTLDDLKIKNIPKHIWNVDQTGIFLDHTPPKILASSKDKTFYITHGKSSNTTLISAVSALGETIPPYLIFKGGKTTPAIERRNSTWD